MFGCSGKLFQLYSLNFITVGDSSAIAYASPVCVVILAHFFLKEKCGLVSIIIALTTCFGVFVITRPPAFTGAANFDTNTLVIFCFTFYLIMNAMVIIACIIVTDWNSPCVIVYAWQRLVIYLYEGITRSAFRIAEHDVYILGS